MLCEDPESLEQRVRAALSPRTFKVEDASNLLQTRDTIDDEPFSAESVENNGG